MLPLIDADTDKAVGLATEVLESFMAQFEAQLVDGLRRKIGLTDGRDGDADLIKRLFAVMQEAGADFTLTFRTLALAAESSNGESTLRELFASSAGIDDWVRDWRERLASDPQSAAERAASMRRVNPAFIPRNHRVEEALSAASERRDLQPFYRLLAILQHPYEEQPEAAGYERPPQQSERVLQTFCGT